MTDTTSRRSLTRIAAGLAALAALGTGSAAATDCMTPDCGRRVRDHRVPAGPARRTPPPADRAQRTAPRIQYTLWNDSDQHIRFRLPSGDDYTLRPGERRRYHNTYRGETLTILVYNTGKSYRLQGGNHRFFWYRPEDRVGLDINYDND